MELYIKFRYSIDSEFYGDESYYDDLEFNKERLEEFNKLCGYDYKTMEEVIKDLKILIHEIIQYVALKNIKKNNILEYSVQLKF